MIVAGISLTVGGLLVLIFARLRERLAIAGAAKLIASLGFLVTAVGSGGFRGDPFGVLMLAGLVLGFFGDAFLIPKDSNRAFLAGLVSFLLGHVCYAAAFVAYGPEWAVTVIAAIVCASLGLVLFRYLDIDRSSRMRSAVMAYITVIVACTAAGIGVLGHPRVAYIVPGVVLFFLSDVGVALDRFKPARLPAYLWSLPAYYAGQTFLALSLMGAES